MFTDNNNKKTEWNDKRKFEKRIGITGEINMEAACCCEARWHGHQLGY